MVKLWNLRNHKFRLNKKLLIFKKPFDSHEISEKFLQILSSLFEPYDAYKILDNLYLCKECPGGNFLGIFGIESTNCKTLTPINYNYLAKINKFLTKSRYISSKSTEQCPQINFSLFKMHLQL
jgi:hypothetical protein